jgi:hypothetical protein
MTIVAIECHGRDKPTIQPTIEPNVERSAKLINDNDLVPATKAD